MSCWPHVRNRYFALRTLRQHGLPSEALQAVFQAMWLISSATLPLHGGVSPQRIIECVWRRSFDDAIDSDIVMTLLRRSTASLCAGADERLFTCITSNRRHLLHPLLAPQQEQHYLLRKRSHGYTFPEHTSSLNDSNFLTRMLYKNIKRFDDIC